MTIFKKPRPVVVVQSDLLAGLQSVLVAPVTTTDPGASPFRPVLEATDATGLEARSWVMADKTMAVPRLRLIRRIGACTPDNLVQIENALLIVLGLRL